MTLQGARSFKVPGMSSKRQKASHTASLDRPMRWTNSALTFGRYFAFCTFAKFFRCAGLVFWCASLVSLCAAHVGVCTRCTQNASDESHMLSLGVHVLHSEDVLPYNPTPQLGSANNCLFRMWDGGLGKHIFTLIPVRVLVWKAGVRMAGVDKSRV